MPTLLRQANRAIETTNKNVIKNPSEDWPKHLPFTLQRYWTTVCASTGEIPLSLVYRSEATVLPIENEVFKKRRDVSFHTQENR